ncbi:MAG: hypothetical protein IJW35_02215 [Lentisphaeria bacterium]|nr:hypothetical protein [Lentisphaeria bacterium]
MDAKRTGNTGNTGNTEYWEYWEYLELLRKADGKRSAATPTTERRVVNTIGLRNFIPILWTVFSFSVTAPGAGNYP